MNLLIQNIRDFRPTVVSIILLAFATVRTFMSGYSIVVTGICASVVPFICQFRRYPAADESVPEARRVLANYFVNIIYMGIYLAYITGVGELGRIFYASYTADPDFAEMMALSICANFIFISCVYTIGHRLNSKQRLMEGILLCNGQLGFMFLAADYVKHVKVLHLNMFAYGFALLIFLLTLGFIRMNYKSGKGYNEKGDVSVS